MLIFEFEADFKLFDLIGRLTGFKLGCWDYLVLPLSDLSMDD